jgi:hypothetical protein
MSKWIKFVQMPRATDRKTDTWQVFGNDGGVDLGAVKFYGAWRKFSFFPSPDTLFEKDCLRDIADFCELQTKQWREGASERARK